MARPATSRLKVNPPLGRMPVLQFMQPGELAVDGSYQRSIAAGESQALIRRIAQHWNWDLCQPLVVSRRPDGGLFVIDGQHRLEAARLRGDISQLPCVVVDYADRADEAASFVHLNQQRRPLGKLDLFKAALASEDPQARAIMDAIEAAGLSLAPHSNYTAWKPGMVSNIAGIENAWRRTGPVLTARALAILAAGFEGQVLRYAGTLFPGIVHAVGDDADRDALVRVLAAQPQSAWSRLIQRRAADCSGGRREAAEIVIAEALAGGGSGVVEPGKFDRRASEESSAPSTAWCEQCDMRVSRAQAEGCRSRWCSLRKASSSGAVARPRMAG